MPKKSRKTSHSKIITHKIEGIPISFFDLRYKNLVKEELKNKFGIYALYDNKKRLYYIGVAQHNIANRIKQHKRDIHKGRWEFFSVYFAKKKSFLKSLEDAFISIVVKPKGNVQQPKKIFKGNKRIIRKMEQIDKEKRMPMSVRGKKINVLKQKNHKKKKPDLKNYFEKSKPLRKVYKDKEYKATLLKSGKIKYKGKLYDNPTRPAKIIVSSPTVNGRDFWRVKTNDNKWVKLSDLLD